MIITASRPRERRAAEKQARPKHRTSTVRRPSKSHPSGRNTWDTSACLRMPCRPTRAPSTRAAPRRSTSTCPCLEARQALSRASEDQTRRHRRRARAPQCVQRAPRVGGTCGSARCQTQGHCSRTGPLVARPTCQKRTPCPRRALRPAEQHESAGTAHNRRPAGNAFCRTAEAASKSLRSERPRDARPLRTQVQPQRQGAPSP